MTQKSRHHIRALTALAILCLGSILWLQGDADTVPPPAPAVSVPVTHPTWGVEDPLTRLLPIDTYTGPLGGRFGLTAARNEVADKQLLLFAGPRAWTGLQISFSDLHGPQKAMLPRTLLHWRLVGSVQTVPPYYQTRYVGLWPDPLLAAAPFDVPALGRASAWIDLHVPLGTRPGDYSGTILVTSHSAPPVRVPVSLHVWGFTLPAQNHIVTSFGIQLEGNHPHDDAAIDDDLLAHRLSPTNCVSAPVTVTPPSPGHPAQLDWTGFDQRVSQRLAQGLTGFSVWFPQPRPLWAAAYQAHLQTKGWLSLAYTYLYDEPYPAQYPAMNADLGAIKSAAPLLHHMVTTRGYPDALTGVDVWCPEIRFFDPAQSQHVQASGQASWWYPAYSTTHPRINLWTDYPALDGRVWAWMTWKYQVDGMLYWDVCYWQSAPDPLHGAGSFNGGSGPANGDGELIYPDPVGKPIDSIRLEAVRDGLQDYEVFCLLEAGVRELKAAHKSPALVASAQALLQIDPSVVTSYTQYNPDPGALLAARERMSQTLEKIERALGHEPQITGRPRLHPEIAALQRQAQRASQAKPR